MHTPFEYFVVFAEMRTGSNMFQEALNSFPGITCYGELFNPHFVEGPVRKSSFDISLADRDADPLGLLGNMRSGAQDTLPGFRFFHDHDPRVFEHCVADPTCAKIVLTRAPLDAYISLKIAQATGQWRLSDISDRKDAKAHFDAGEYAVFLEDRSNFAARLEAGLQVNGQAAFRLTYGDLGDVSKLNGVARYLGVPDQVRKLTIKARKQNPGPLREKVANFEAMQNALRQDERLGSGQNPDLEPRRGPRVPDIRAASALGLLYFPLPGTPSDTISDWLAKQNGEPLETGFNRRTLTSWKDRHPGHRSFTVLEHPVGRAWWAFRQRVLDKKGQVRTTLMSRFDMPDVTATCDPNRVQAAFLAFVGFLKANLNAQTALQVQDVWASQTALINGFAEVQLPDHLFRTSTFTSDVQMILPADTGHGAILDPPADPLLEGIYSSEVEAGVRAAYRRDYTQFGFADWRP